MYDVIIIGGGSGGYTAAIRASQLGGKVALIEGADIGGTCVNRGCIPSKIWLHAAYMLYWLDKADKFGIRIAKEGLDLKRIVDRKNGVAADIRMGMEGLLANNSVEVIRGWASIKSPKEVEVDGNALETRTIIIATGSTLITPNVKGLEKASLTTDQVLEMSAIPSSVLVWGDIGPIEVEMATLLNMLGCKVFLASSSRRILPKEDGDSSQRLAKALKEQGVEVVSQVTLKEVKKGDSGFEAVLSGNKEYTIGVERVLVSARKPNLGGLGLEKLDIRVDEDDGITTDEKLETSIKGIYAIGDVTGGWMLSHAASSMAIVAAENAMGRNRQFPFNLVPRGIWTIPQVAAVGLSEEEAEERGFEVETGDFPYSINGLGMGIDETVGAVKVVSDARYGEILGVHIVGANATELIGEAVIAMQLECTANEFSRSIRVHPSFSENLVEAARDAEHWAIYLPRQ